MWVNKIRKRMTSYNMSMIIVTFSFFFIFTNEFRGFNNIKVLTFRWFCIFYLKILLKLKAIGGKKSNEMCLIIFVYVGDLGHSMRIHLEPPRWPSQIFMKFFLQVPPHLWWTHAKMSYFRHFSTMTNFHAAITQKPFLWWPLFFPYYKLVT